MHDYLRAIGFSSLKSNNDVHKVLKDVISQPTEEICSVSGKSSAFAEKRKLFSEHMGIAVRGEYTEDGSFRNDYYFPYLKGNHVTLQDDVVIEKYAQNDSYAGVCDDVKVGVSLIFYLLNAMEYRNQPKRDTEEWDNARIHLSALSISGKVILPLFKEEAEKGEKKIRDGKYQNRDHMLAAARKGDEEAIESLTLEDMDTYTIVSKRARREDVLTIVESYFMPYGIACDQYSIMGDIVDVKEEVNEITDEKVIVLTVVSNEVAFDICRIILYAIWYCL